jgi:predicted DNA-binding transcriptional regulator YafY
LTNSFTGKSTKISFRHLLTQVSEFIVITGTILRNAAKQQIKVQFDYTRADGQASSRTVHPLGLFYWGKIWTLAAWCELRDDFRHFRLDRMENLQPTYTNYPSLPGRTLQDFLATVCDNTLAGG